MKPKAIAGSALAATLMGVGVLAGSVIGNPTASAQTPSATPSTTITAPSTTNPATPADPSTGMPFGRAGGMGGPGGMGGGRGHGGGGMDGGLFGGGIATADGATRSITNATDSITRANTDLAYATGKMDTTQVQKWLDGAASLLKSAETANTASQYGQANAYATAAGELARAANSVMSKELGAANLPSYATQPQRGDKDQGAATTAPTITQAQASRMLSEVYNNLVAKAAAIKGASNASEATTYLTDAQNAYKAAYDAYGAGNYADAATSARLAGQLGQVASSIASASTAPANADTPVTVPAPNF